MSNFILSCSSTVDLSKDYLEKRGIRYICFPYEIDGKDFKDDLGTTIPFHKFYDMIREGSDTKTSQINISEYLAYFEKLLGEGKDILHLDFSSGLSGSVNSAVNAANMLAEKYPDRKVVVIDSLCASSGHGLFVDKAADLRDEGMEFDELARWLEENKLHLNHWFFSTTLKYYIKGGRVSKPAGYIGEVLGICPLLHVDWAGKLVPMEKIRSKKKVKKRIVEKMIEHAYDGLNYSDKCFVSNSDCYEDAKEVADLIESTFPNLKGNVQIFDIGTIIGSHAGPGTVAVFFWGKDR